MTTAATTTSLSRRMSRPPRRRGLNRCARALTLGMIGVGTLVAWRSSGAVMTLRDIGDVQEWGASTDVVAAVLPLLFLALIVIVGVLGCLTVVYAGLRACGCARAAAACAVLVVPRVRVHLDRAIAIGVVASVFTVAHPAYALDGGDPGIVRAPAATGEVVSDAIRDPGPVPAEATPAPDTGSAPVEPVPDLPAVVRDPADPTNAVPVEDPGASGVRDGLVADDSARAAGARPAVPASPHAAGTETSRTGADPQGLGLRDVMPGPGTGSGDASLAPGAPTAAGGAPNSYTVRPGDNLWVIAASTVGHARGVDAASLTDHDVAVYWVQLVEANRAALRSGNPSLIYAGEVLTLPPAP